MYQNTPSKKDPSASTGSCRDTNNEKPESGKRLSEVDVDLRGVGLEYYCIICGRRFGSRQGLRGHLKVHRGQFVETSFYVPRTTRDAFKEVCRAHGLTTCHMLVSFMDAVVQAFRKGGTVEFDVRSERMRVKGGVNPINVSIYQQFLGKPRSAWKLPLPPRVHEVELGCEVCGGPAEFLHLKRDPIVGVVYMALCDVHHKRSLEFHSTAYVDLREASVKKVH